MKREYLLLIRRTAKVLNIHDFMMDSLTRIKNLRTENGYRRFKTSPGDFDKITAVILSSSGSRFYDRCLESVTNQSLAPCTINTIKDVSPFSLAAQKALDSVKTPFYVQVDDDMILNRNCFKRLYYYMISGINCAESVLRLNDPVMGRIYGVHMYRTKIISKIGFHPLLKEKGAERKLSEKIEEEGFHSRYADIIAGSHHPAYSPEDAYLKYRFIGEQYAYYEGGKGKEIMQVKLDRLCEYWLESHSLLFLYAMAGLLEGITGEDPSAQLSFNEQNKNEIFQKLDCVLSKFR